MAIIGGGVTGLTAAFRFQQHRIPAVLFEAADRVGGVIQTVREGGYLAECGPNTILETSPLIRELVAELGLEDHRIDTSESAENRYIVRNKRPVKLPSSPLSFMASPLFSCRAKARLLAEPFIRRAHAEEEESLAKFVRRRIGGEFLDYAINPFVAGVYAGAPERLSVREAFPKLHALEQRYGSLILGQIFSAQERKRSGTVSRQNAPKFSFNHGLQTLTDALGQRLKNQIHTGQAIRTITRRDKAWSLGQAEDFAAVLLALPAFRLAELQLTSNSNRVSMSELGEMQYAPVASVVLGFRREDVVHPLNGFGALNPEVEKLNSLGTIFSSSLFPGRAPLGQVLLTSYIGGLRAPHLVTKTPEKLYDLVREDLNLVLGVSGKPTYRHVFTHRRAIPQYDIGFGRFKAFMNKLEQNNCGLFFAGHCRDGISMVDSIVSGHEAAGRIANYLKN